MLKKIFVLGFDPVFLDIIVSPLDNANQKLADFPPIGEHVTNTNVVFVPGGNALNVARVLTKITTDVYFFGSMDNYFLELVHSNLPSLNCFATRIKEPNVTVAMQFQNGEIQMNSLKSGFSTQDLTVQALLYVTLSQIIPFSNIGLNAEGPPLFDFLTSFFIDLSQSFQSSSGKFSYQALKEFMVNWFVTHGSDHLNQEFSSIDTSLFDNLTFNLSSKISYFDPSSLKTFSNWSWLNSFFSDQFALLPGYKIISLNEYEFALLEKNNISFPHFLNHKNCFVIIHDSKSVTILSFNNSDKITLKVPPLDEKDIVSSVGAGDSFNAGLLYDFSLSFDIVSACKAGISIAALYRMKSGEMLQPDLRKINE